jgi:hypothetical protein
VLFYVVFKETNRLLIVRLALSLRHPITNPTPELPFPIDKLRLKDEFCMFIVVWLPI